MSNKASSHLHELIHSLNKSEKRYFKVFSSRHTIGDENAYIKLFDYLDKMICYNEEEVFKHFKGQAFLNKFSITKARLYNNILRSLDTFHSTSSTDAQIFRLIHSAEILYKKGLYKQCEKILSSAEKKAVKHENFYLLLEIKEKQKKLIENELYSEVKADDIQQMFEAERLITHEITNYQTLWNVKSLLFKEINKNGQLRGDENRLMLRNMVHKVEEMDLKSASTKSRYLFHHIQSAYHFSLNAFDSSLEHLLSIIELLENSISLKNEQPNLYFSALTNLIYVSTKLKNYDMAEVHLSKLKGFAEPGKNIDLDIKYFSSTYSLELSLLADKGDYSKAITLVPEIEEGYRLYDGHIPHLRKAYIDFQVGVIYLSQGEYHKALSWINKILNEGKIDQKQDIFCFAQLINLILHFELNNSRFLPYAINSTKRYLKNRSQVYKFEEVFLKLISQISRTHNVFDLQDKLAPIEEQLVALKEDPQEQLVFEYFDFLSWVRSKLKQCSFAELKRAELKIA